MYYRLGLDLGTNSIGWTILERKSKRESLKAWSLVNMGVRIFPDSREPSKGGRIGDSLAATRRLARGMRRNRDRGKNRKAYMMARLVEMGLMPKNSEERKALESLNPYKLRAEGLERPLNSYELGRVLFHLGNRRGFKSNRKESTEKKEDGKRTEQISALREALGNKTLGQFLWDRHQAGKALRFRDNTEWFPDRAMYAEEFDALRDVQAPHHSLSDEDWLKLRNESILFQHPLKPVERGRCTLRPEFLRAHRDTPIAQWFRIYQDLGNLRWVDPSLVSHPLTPEQRQAIVDKLLIQKSITWGGIRKLKGADGQRLFSRDGQFNLEDEKRKGLDGHKVAVWMKNNTELAPLWDEMDAKTLDDIFEDLHAAQEDERLVVALVDKYGLSRDQAEAFAALPLSSVTQSLSRQVMEELVPIIRDQGIEYFDAVKQLAGEGGNPLHHSQIYKAERMDRLPYYGEVLHQSVLGGDSRKDKEKDPEGHFGKINNPTVHVTLNQLRKVVNALIDHYGCPPSEIRVELSRDLKLGPKQRSEINREIAKNTKRNDALRKEWERLSGGRPATASDLKKLKLWEELGVDELPRRCVFTGKTIAAHHLINGEVEIEHLLPFSRTLDDSMANLTLSFKGANRAKGKKTPFEAFADSRHPDFDWQEILDRVSRLPKAKQWRFTEDAMDKWLGENDFIARQLTDNQYIARAARGYLTVLTDNVAPAPGRLTAMIRGKWRLNLGEEGQKARDDHRHHAIDAFVVALCDRGLLQKISTLTARGADDRLHLAIPDLPDALRRQFDEKLAGIIVSYKQDHGFEGRLFNETAYGVLKEKTEEGHNLVVRKPINELSPNEIHDIRDEAIRKKMEEYLYEAGWYSLDKTESAKKLPVLLAAFGRENNIRRLRILVKNQSAKSIPSAPHKAYAPDSYVCCDIWAKPKGKKGKWIPNEEIFEGIFWSYFDCSNGVPDKEQGKPHPGARFVMRLFKDDMVSYIEDGQERVMRVTGLNASSRRVELAPHNIANFPQKPFTINTLGAKGLKQVHITPCGQRLGVRKKP